MTWAISYGIIDARPVFMDERTDSYFVLDGELEASFLTHCAHGDITPVVMQELREALGIEGDCGLVAFARCSRARQSLMAESFVRDGARLGDVFSLARVLHRTRRSLATQPIEEILAEFVETDNGGAGHGAQEQLVRLVGRFLAARPLAPFKANCLLDSLALLRWLGPSRAGAMLVFGAKLDPFSAHCWVQSGDLLLNDRVDQVARFGPVRVLTCSAVTR